MVNFNKEDKLMKILFEDDCILVINKKNGLLSHCNNKGTQSSVVSLLKKNKIKLYESEDRLRDGIVHRLDKDTSGLMVLAKNLFAYKSLVKQFQNRKVTKIYQAYCWGIPLPIAGIINKPISNYLNRKKASTKGKDAITEYKVTKNFNNYFSEIECKILTGRTHQIRVHMQSINCPLIGDQLYSRNRNISQSFSKNIISFLKKFRRQALHAQHLSFRHPKSDKLKYFDAEVPHDILELKNELIAEFNLVC
tara:strand:- start:1840 stop:2589 length:750 start_codon:yes stop_codon:yes gene_type:complete